MSNTVANSRSKTFRKRLHSTELVVAELLVASQPFMVTAAEAPVPEAQPEPEPPSQQQKAADQSLVVEVTYTSPKPQLQQEVEFRAMPASSVTKPSLEVKLENLGRINTHQIAKTLQKKVQAESSTATTQSNTEAIAANPSSEADDTSLVFKREPKESNTEISQDNPETEAIATLTDLDTSPNTLSEKRKKTKNAEGTTNNTDNTTAISTNNSLNTSNNEQLPLFDHNHELSYLEESPQQQAINNTETNNLINPDNSETDISDALTIVQKTTPDLQLEDDLLESPASPELNQFDPNIPAIDWQSTVIQALSVAAQRYPFIIDPTDRITFQPSSFNPDRFQDYSTSNLRFAENNPIINLLTYGHFPEEKQFFWIVDDNTIVIETEGMHAGILHQGRSDRTQGSLTALLNQRFFGVQAIISSPQSLSELIGQAGGLSNITAIAGSITTPVGVPAGTVTLNSGVDANAPNVTRISNLVPIVGDPSTGSTSSPTGGGALFTNLDAENAPEILQGFPTNDLSPLIDNINFTEGTLIPDENLIAAKIGFADPFTNLGFNFAAPVTSRPGLQVAQPGGGMSDGLLNISINPFLTDRERELAYLDSLFWFPLGQLQESIDAGDPILENQALLPDDQTNLGQNNTSRNVDDWYRIYFSGSHKRTAVEFDRELPQSAYRNLFSAPGISFNTSFRDADGVHFLNGTLGLMMGYLFDEINVKEIDEPLEKSYQEFTNGEPFNSLKIAATDDEQRQLNQRLNQNLINSNRFSELEQLSGDLSQGDIKLNDSSITHLRTGLYQRNVEFKRGGLDAFEGSFGTAFFSNLDTSEDTFGDLVFQGVLVPLDDTNIQRENTRAAAEILFTTADGQQVIENYDTTVYPVIGGKGSDIAFDNIEISRLYNGRFDVGQYLGKISLPSIEFLHTGTQGDLNYGLTLGTWFNLDPTIAGSIHNNIGLPEPSIGAYLRTSANLLLQDVQFDNEQKFVSATTQIPFFDMNWNSATNRLNTFRTQLGYLISHQDLNKLYSLTAALNYSPNGINNIIPANSNGELIGLLNGRLDTKPGLSLSANFEIGKRTFVDLEVTQEIFDHIQAGVYYKNFTTNNIGLNSRIDDTNYGLVLKYEKARDGISINARIGHNSNGFDAEIKSVVSFNF